MPDFPTLAPGDEVGFVVDVDSKEAENARDIDGVYRRETEIILDGIVIMETTLQAFGFECEEDGGGTANDEALGKLKNEMRIAQASLHTLAEENIAFKNGHPGRGDALEARVANFRGLAHCFKKVAEKFENIHTEQLDILKSSLDSLTNGSIYLPKSRDDALEISSITGRKTLEDYLREVGVEKAEMIQVLLDDKKKMQARIYYMQHLIADMNTILAVQQGLLPDAQSKSDAGGPLTRRCGEMPFGVVLSWLMLLFLGVGPG